MSASSRTPDPASKTWESDAPYKTPIQNPSFAAKYTGHCHCRRIEYQISRDAPLDAKFCHCRTCQAIHGAPFQWAAIFHKDDIRFLHGVTGLRFYNSGKMAAEHTLPCKVSCAHCGSLIMDEGRNMTLVFPGLIDLKTKSEKARFAAKCHMFYADRVVDILDELPKWAGMPEKSELLKRRDNS